MVVMEGATEVHTEEGVMEGEIRLKGGLKG